MFRRVYYAVLAATVCCRSSAEGACTSVEPIAGLAVHGKAEPLMGLIRSGQIGVDDAQPWIQGDARSTATPLCAAISAGKEEAVVELLHRGADANKACTRHHTPLDWTTETFYQPASLGIAGLLLERGAVAVVYRGVQSLADVEAEMARKNSALGQPVPSKG
ncbi:MAG: ankyrin repeat domain-containing protein [Lautropia sp.]|nr:ankyrin repeat domain-containing protein [Lautropia sp.]